MRLWKNMLKTWNLKGIKLAELGLKALRKSG